MDWNAIIAIAAFGAFLVAGVTVFRDWLRNQRRRQEEDEHIQEGTAERIERIEVLLAGTKRDPITNMPGTPGFTTKVESFMQETTEFQTTVMESLRFNGDGNLKAAVKRLTGTMKELIRASADR